MYFTVKLIEKISEKSVGFSHKTNVLGADCPYLTDILNTISAGEIACHSIVVQMGIPDDIKKRIGENTL